jgi:hypothetical protein
MANIPSSGDAHGIGSLFTPAAVDSICHYRDPALEPRTINTLRRRGQQPPIPRLPSCTSVAFANFSTVKGRAAAGLLSRSAFVHV